MSDQDFVADPQLQIVVTQAAAKCVEFVKLKFGKTLDYSDKSVNEIESVLAVLHQSIPAEKPSQEDIQDYATLFGSYLGETYRKNHGGEWGIGSGTVALGIGSGYLAFPWARAFKRLTHGEEDGVDAWYYGMIQYGASGEKQAAAPPPLPVAPPPLPAKKKNPFDFFG